MAEVRVSNAPVSELIVTPGVCAISGMPTTDCVRLSGLAAPAWTPWLVLFGLLPWLFARQAAGRPYRLTIGLDRTITARRRAWQRAAWGLVVGGVALLLAFGPGSSTAALWCLLLVGAGLVLACVNLVRHSVGVTLADDGGLVLTRVHPRFRDAVRQSGRGHRPVRPLGLWPSGAAGSRNPDPSRGWS